MIGIAVLFVGLGVLWLCFAVGSTTSPAPGARVCASSAWRTSAGNTCASS